MNLPIYLDHHATTPVEPRVLAEMLPFFTETFGNASSTDHEHGAEAFGAVGKARERVGKLLNCRPEEIIFTSGATEANNLALIGAMDQYAAKGDHLITVVTEHPAVLDTCRYLEKAGKRVTYLPVDSWGLVDLDALRHAITPQTVLVSVMAANNEVGTLAPLSQIGAIAHEHEILFHTDATQAVGHIPLDVEASHIDLLSLSAHKFYGPKGVGALYVRRARPRVKVAPLFYGGGHERGMRSGTLNVPGIVGLGAAAKIALREMGDLENRLRTLRDHLWNGLQKEIEEIELNGPPLDGPRLSHNLSVTLKGVESRSLIVLLKHDLSISTGSACATAKVEASHVLLALGHNADRAHQSLRLGLGRGIGRDEIDLGAQFLTRAVFRLKKLSRSIQA